MPTEPSRLATWLLQRFGSSPNNDSIIGDLNEQYRRGRSPFWYWRQVFVAIVVGTVSDVGRNKFLAARALLTGWSLVFIGAKLIAPLIDLLRGKPLGTGLLPGSWVAVRW